MSLAYQRPKSLKGSIGCIYSPKRSKQHYKNPQYFYNSFNSSPKHYLLNARQQNRLNQSNQNNRQNRQELPYQRRRYNQQKGYMTSQEDEQSNFSDFEIDEYCYYQTSKNLKTEPQRNYGQFSPFRMDSNKYRQRPVKKYQFCKPFQTQNNFYPEKQIALKKARVQYQQAKNKVLDDSREHFKNNQILQIKQIQRRLKRVKNLEKSLRQQEIYRSYKSTPKYQEYSNQRFLDQERQRSKINQQITDINQLCQTVQHQYGHLMQTRPQSRKIQHKQLVSNAIDKPQNKLMSHKQAQVGNSRNSKQKNIRNANKIDRDTSFANRNMKSNKDHHYYTQPVQQVKSIQQANKNGQRGGICFEIDTKMFAYISKANSKQKRHPQVSMNRQSLQSRFMNHKNVNSKQQILKRRNNAKLYDKWARKNVLGFK